MFRWYFTANFVINNYLSVSAFISPFTSPDVLLAALPTRHFCDHYFIKCIRTNQRNFFRHRLACFFKYIVFILILFILIWSNPQATQTIIHGLIFASWIFGKKRVSPREEVKGRTSLINEEQTVQPNQFKNLDVRTRNHVIFVIDRCSRKKLISSVHSPVFVPDMLPESFLERTWSRLESQRRDSFRSWGSTAINILANMWLSRRKY